MYIAVTLKYEHEQVTVIKFFERSMGQGHFFVEYLVIGVLKSVVD